MAQSNEKITCIAVTLRIGHAVAGSLIRNLLGKPLFKDIDDTEGAHQPLNRSSDASCVTSVSKR